MALQSSVTAADPIFRPENGSSGTTAETIGSNPFTFSMPLNVLLLLTVLFLVGFFFIYSRRFSRESPPEHWRRTQPSPSATGSTLLLRNQKRGGFKSSTTKALPTVSYPGVNVANLFNTDCSICLSELEEGETVKLIPHCRHVFHSPCLDTWLSSHELCPVCRGAQFFRAPGGPDHDDVELPLDVVVEEGGDGGRSTADGCDTTLRGEMMRKSVSSTNLGDRPVVLHRSFSF